MKKVFNIGYKTRRGNNYSFAVKAADEIEALQKAEKLCVTGRAFKVLGILEALPKRVTVKL